MRNFQLVFITYARHQNAIMGRMQGLLLSTARVHNICVLAVALLLCASRAADVDEAFEREVTIDPEGAPLGMVLQSEGKVRLVRGLGRCACVAAGSEAAVQMLAAAMPAEPPAAAPPKNGRRASMRDSVRE